MFNSFFSLVAKSNSNLYVAYLRKKGFKIGTGVRFFGRCNIDEGMPKMIEIGDHVIFSADVTILSHGYEWVVAQNIYGASPAWSEKVVVGSNCFIGQGTTVLKGVRIGSNCIIGAASVVSRDIPKNSVAAGNPCRVLCTLDAFQAKKVKELSAACFTSAKLFCDKLEEEGSIDAKFRRTVLEPAIAKILG